MCGQLVRRVANQTQVVDAVQPLGEGKVGYVVACTHYDSFRSAKLGKSRGRSCRLYQIISVVRLFCGDSVACYEMCRIRPPCRKFGGGGWSPRRFMMVLLFLQGSDKCLIMHS